MCPQPGPTGNRSSTRALTLSPRPRRKKNKLKIADGNTRFTGSAGKEEVEVNEVEEESLVQGGEGS